MPLGSQYPSILRASEFQLLGPPEQVIERARRLYVLSPLIDPDETWTPYRFAFDYHFKTAFYLLDLRQGECATLAVSHLGVVLAGVVADATSRMWYTKAEIKSAVHSVDLGSRELLMILMHDQFAMHLARSFCMWCPRGESQWRAAPEMLKDENTRADPIGMCEHLGAPAEYVVAFVEHYTESKSIADHVKRYLSLVQPTRAWIDDLENVPESTLTLMRERAWVAGLYL
jgi:hypothetical protein